MGNLNVLQTTARTGSGLVGSPLEPLTSINTAQQAIALDESALFGTASPVPSTGFGTGINYPSVDLFLTQLNAPSFTITQGGTAATTSYTYVVSDTGNSGSAPTSVVTATGPAALSTTNYNILSISTIVNHVYTVFRSASSGTPNSLGLLFTVIGTGGLVTVTDTGAISPATTPEIATANTSGQATIPGPANVGVVFSGMGNGLGGKATIAGAGNVTWTAAQFLSDIAVRTGSVAPTDPSPTAQQLVAQAGPNIKAGAVHPVLIRNEGSGTWTLSAGTGVTLRAANTNTIVTVAARQFWVVFTTVTPGSEAVEVISGASTTF